MVMAATLCRGFECSSTLRCFACELVMGVVGPVLDVLDRVGMGRTKLYAFVDWPYDVAWNAFDDLKPDVQRRLAHN
jgi:hypothetical protein